MPRGIYQHKKRPDLILINKSEKQRMAVSRALKGRPSPFKGKKRKPLSEETKKKMSEAKKKNPTKYWLGKKRQNISERRKGIKFSKEHKKKLSEAHKGKYCGDKHPNWQGGKSFEPYSIDWTKTLKRAIQERDYFTCQLCKVQENLCVHHIDYNKKNCCSENLITLCMSCNAKVNFNRNYWSKFLCVKK